MVPLFGNGMCIAKTSKPTNTFKSPFNFSLRWYILCLWKFLLFLTPVLWFPFFCFVFILFFLDNGVKEIEPYEGLYIKEGLFCADSLFGGLCEQK